MTVRSFEDLEIWKEARRLTGLIYRLTRNPKFSKDFRLGGQIQGAVVSIMSNIAEGFERGGNQEFIQFLYIAKGRVGKCVLSYTSHLIKATWTRKKPVS